MNYGSTYVGGYAPQSPTGQSLTALRPDQISSLVALARERVAFMIEQRDVVSEGLAEIVLSHEGIISHYNAEISRELDLIARMGSYASGARMVPDAAPLANYGPEPEASPQMSALQRLALQDAAAQGFSRQAILSAFNSSADLQPSPALNGRSKREVVESAMPVPQTGVQVVHYEAGEELPAEALPGHMTTEPRTATELAAARQVEEARLPAPAPEAKAATAVIVDGALSAAELAGESFSPVVVDGALDMADLVSGEQVAATPAATPAETAG